MWKVEGYTNSIREVAKPNGSPSAKFFDTEYEALRYMFDRSIAAASDLEDQAEQHRLKHNRMCKKFGARLRELRP